MPNPITEWIGKGVRTQWRLISLASLRETERMSCVAISLRADLGNDFERAEADSFSWRWVRDFVR